MSLTEYDLQRRIIDTAKAFGWRCVHIRAVRLPSGAWGVPYEGDLGLPDLILAKDGKVLLAELKSESGTATKDQQAWLDAAADEGRLWRPTDWPAILAELSGKKPTEPVAQCDGQLTISDVA